MESESVSSDVTLQPITTISGTKVPTLQWSDVCKPLDDAYPHADFYHNEAGANNFRKRPSLAQLRATNEHVDQNGGIVGDKFPFPSEIDEESETGTRSESSGVMKFGWIKGVLARNILNMFGAVLFLRVSWVTAQAGIGLASVIILLSSTVTTITALSMSAISTNGEVRGGGAYYMISRSLGPEFGGPIGIIYSLANAFGAALPLIGFSETIRNIFKEFDVMPFTDTNAIRIIGLITVTVLIIITLFGLDWESRVQLLLLFILTVALGNVVTGSFIPPNETEKAKGFLSYQGSLFVENFAPDFRNGYNFFTIFAVFFPAATGFLSGASISGNLKDPQRAIPKGTLLAILITSTIYLFLIWITGLCNMRDACGPLPPPAPAVNDSVSTPETTTLSPVTAAVSGNGSLWCVIPKYGIQNDFQV